MAAGYVYVLVNSSMPGLLKVGKTRRLPSDRVQELSRASGVATPFVVAFEELFDDCDTAEEAVHAELELRGFRQAQNREFFRATTNEVIRIILGVAARSKPPSRAPAIHNGKDTSGAPWNDLIIEADELMFGFRDVIQDTDEAIRLYKIAAQMGSPLAYHRLGWAYRWDSEIPRSDREALRWLREGVKRGAYNCYIPMAEIFCDLERFEDALKAFRKCFDAKIAWQAAAADTGDINSHISLDIRQYVYTCLDYRLPIEFPQFIGKIRGEILSRVIPRLTDKIFPKERQELTRVRDTLIATIEISDEEIDKLLATGEAIEGLLGEELDSFISSLDAMKQSPGEIGKVEKLDPTVLEMEKSNPSNADADYRGAPIVAPLPLTGWRRALVWIGLG